MKAIKPGDSVRLKPHALRLYNMPEGLIYKVKSADRYVHIWEHPDLIFVPGEIDPVKPVHKTPEAVIWGAIVTFCLVLTAVAVWLFKNDNNFNKLID